MKRPLVWEIIWIAGLSIGGIILGILSVYFFGTRSSINITDYPLKQPSILYDRTGTHELYRLYDEENRVIIGHQDIPDGIRFATIAAEDAHFYTHHGIDIISMARALKVNFESGEIRQGGSTITQQLARILYLTRERTIKRKINEMFLALKIEAEFSKEQILDTYLNAVPYGSNAYGIETASLTFFGKNAKQLTLAESALLAALPNAPTYYSPYGNQNDLLRARQQAILSRMYELGYITSPELAAARSIDIIGEIIPPKNHIIAPHFVFYALEQLAKDYTKETLQTEGLHIRTTLDLDLQNKAEQAVRNGAKKNLARRAENAGLVALDPRSGEILAMVGSKDYFDATIDGNVNVTTRRRQPGSAFKPFAYAAAFEKGYQPESPIEDKPINFGPDGSGKPYTPRNYDGTFHGMMTMRDALAMSLNVPAVQTLALAGIENTIRLATRLGITTLDDPKRYGLALVLGGAEVRPLDMASAFGVFGQEGVRHDIHPFLEITDQKNEAQETGFDQEGIRVLDTDIARKINSILSDNKARTPIFGPNSPLAFPAGTIVAGKTGTTQNFRDAWTVGYTPFIAVAVWAGNNDNRPMAEGADGIFVAAPIWREFMNDALIRFPQTGFTAYAQIGTAPTGAEHFNDAPQRMIYFDTKTGREISPEKARKMEKGRVDVRSTR